MNYNQEVRLHVWGDFACFTRPEMKVERVSYDVMTPSSARGVLEAVLWKESIRWRITRIDVIKPVKWISVRRNEVSVVASVSNAKSAMKKGSGALGFCIEDHRQQRAGLFLRDVEYVIHANFLMTEKARPGDTPAKYSEMFQRRAFKGQCFNQPYLGCREFSCSFASIAPDDPLPEPIEDTRDLGWMLYDQDFSGDTPLPKFFNAKIENGRINVPAIDSEEVRG